MCSFAFQLSSLFTSTVWYNACITVHAAPIHLSISWSIFLSHMNNSPRYLNYYIYSQQGRNNILFPDRESWPQTQEMVTFFPAASHSTANYSCAYSRSQSDEANRTRLETQFWDFETRHSPPLAAPWNSFPENHKQNQWQGTTLNDQNIYCKCVWHTTRNIGKALTLVT